MTESKVHYDEHLVSVNILFGDPETEVPASNVNALCGYFDENLVPRYAADRRDLIEKLEAASLQFARAEDLRVSEAIDEAADECPEGVTELSRLLKRSLSKAKTKPELMRLWQLEKIRTRRLGEPPDPGIRRHFKRNILRSLFFLDGHFKELLTKADPADYSKELSEQLVRCKLARWEEQIQGDVLLIDPEFADYLRNPEAKRLRDLCKRRLEKSNEMKWYFADIQDFQRRKKMSSTYLAIKKSDGSNLADIIENNLRSDKFQKINHCRCWVADLLARSLDVSHNRMNRGIVSLGYDSEKLGNPFNQISYKSSRFMGKPASHKEYCIGVQLVAQQIAGKEDIILALDSETLSDRLLELRLDGVLKLQKLNPLYLVLESICEELALAFTHEGTKSIISDLANAAKSVAKFDLYHISKNEHKIIANAVAVKDQNGDHKSKEWGARRRAVGYRLDSGHVRPAEFDEALFIIDGDWEAKHVARLHRSGWTRIIRLDQIEETLRDVFDIPEERPMTIPDYEPLPLAAENETPIEIKKSN